MLFFDGIVGLALLGLWLFCVIDVIMTEEAACRNLPKTAWVLFVLLMLDLGAVLWLIAGRTWDRSSNSAGYRPAGTTPYIEYDLPGRFVASRPEDDEEFLRRCRERAEEQRRLYREQQKKHEQD